MLCRPCRFSALPESFWMSHCRIARAALRKLLGQSNRYSRIFIPPLSAAPDGPELKGSRTPEPSHPCLRCPGGGSSASRSRHARHVTSAARHSAVTHALRRLVLRDGHRRPRGRAGSRTELRERACRRGGSPRVRSGQSGSERVESVGSGAEDPGVTVETRPE